MKASSFTIYQLNTSKTWDEIIYNFNKEKKEDKQYKINQNNAHKKFEFIKHYRLYTRAAETTPKWSGVVSELVTDLGKVKNVNNSYVLFLEVEGETYVATGGQGFEVIASVKNFNFGMEVLSRLVAKDENVIKKINERHLTGNIVGGNHQYRRNVSINSESGINTFNSFLNEVYSALPSKTINRKLGIQIKTKKEDYRFMAKDSISLSKALTLNELDSLLGAISNLLKEESYSINPIYEINKKDPIVQNLNRHLARGLKDYLENPEGNESINIIPFYNDFDEQYIHFNQGQRQIYETEKDIICYLKKTMSFDKELYDLIGVLNNIKLTSVTEDGDEITNPLYTHLEADFFYGSKTYWLRDGKWLFLERGFIQEINNSFVANVVNEYNQDFNLKEINAWCGEKEKEGDFNFNHNEKPSVYVLDKILYQNIELCDLLIIREDELFFVHVKDGLDGEVRVLASQIENSMRTLYEGIHVQSEILVEYYQNIIRKIKEVEYEKQESTISKAARKFRRDFPNSAIFVDLITSMEKNIKFVFAYRPKDNHNFLKPESIRSTPAKLSILHLVKTKKEYNYKLDFLKIKRTTEELIKSSK